MKKFMALVLLAAASVATPAFGFFGWNNCCGETTECCAMEEACPTCEVDFDDCGC